KLDASGNIIDGLYWNNTAQGRWTWGKHGDDQFARLLIKEDIPWPRLRSGALEMKENNFKDHPNPLIQRIHRLRGSMSVLQSNSMEIAHDRRHRCMMLTFKTGTSRNAPRNSIFAAAVWVRSALMAPPGYSLIAEDWSNQEIAIVAILSGDQELIRAYETGDRLGGRSGQGAQSRHVAQQPPRRDPAANAEIGAASHSLRHGAGLARPQARRHAA